MADKISGYSRAALDINPSRHHAVGKAGSATDAKTPAAGPTASKTDGVDLSPTVSNLKKIEARLRELPDVDQARVDELRGQIESGEYQVDENAVAAKLLRLDRELG
ncbi:MAG TPA: flagellar biosynthesis anti-sigma factor FlgM [Chromatiales bacterium]|nr:flagellar biosynthesis anti-sigma factor FlgM [Chromatiales bacterium]